MPVMTDRQSVPANGTVQNVIAGRIGEFLAAPGSVVLYGTAAAIGLNFSLIVGGSVIVDDQEASAANRMPLVPDDFIAAAGGMQGDRVIVRLRNTTGAAIIAFTRVEVP